MAIAPFHEQDERGAELASFVGEDVLGPAGPLGIWNAVQNALVGQQLEAVGEHVGRDPKAALEVLESFDAEHGVAQDQQRPALADDF
jgi:hypothetical protein